MNEAYRLAVEKIFGKKGGNLFDRVGGLKNGTAGELISRIFQAAGDQEKQLLPIAKEFLEEHQSDLAGLVPSGKGAPFAWSEFHPLLRVTELLVRVKLSILMEQIDSRWPLPCEGVRELFQAIATVNSLSNGLEIHPAIVSSGHDFFIQRCFEVWGLQCPMTLLTDDEMRRSVHNELSPEERVKPSRLLLDMVFRNCQFDAQEHHRDGACGVINAYKQLTYGGDDLGKDGEMAHRRGTPFLWYNPRNINPDGYRGNLWNFQTWSGPAELFADQHTASALEEHQSFGGIVKDWISRS